MEIDKILEQHKNPEKAEILQRFFKTGKGEYGEGDVFLGLTMGQEREIVKEFWEIDLDSVQKLINSKIHEKRSIGFLILVEKFEKAKDENVKKEIIDFYLQNSKRANNWDLVDLSAYKTLGKFLLNKDRSVLYDLAKSDNLWEKRIAIVSTFAFIKNSGKNSLSQKSKLRLRADEIERLSGIRKGDFEDTLKIAELLLGDSHDLIHKAVGWMLREVGKKNQKVLEDFLKVHYRTMPRTMLRYSIERFDEELRQKYLKGEI